MRDGERLGMTPLLLLRDDDDSDDVPATLTTPPMSDSPRITAPAMISPLPGVFRRGEGGGGAAHGCGNPAGWAARVTGLGKRRWKPCGTC